MQLPLEHGLLRPLRSVDAAPLAALANNRRIWRNLRDPFPHPYHEKDAIEFIAACTADSQPATFAVELDGELAGVIGMQPKSDLSRRTRELGYWLGEPFWGRGVMTGAVRELTRWAIDEFDLVRIEAGVFEWNPASARVLEKAGYVRESTQRRAVFKDGQIIDRWLYTYIVG